MIGSLAPKSNAIQGCYLTEGTVSRSIQDDLLRESLSDEFVIEQGRKLCSDFSPNEIDKLEINTKPQDTNKTTEKKVSPTVKFLRKLFKKS